jgi:predicted esterase
MSDAGGRDAHRAVEHHLPVLRSARYWTLGDAHHDGEIWFVLHGYKQLARRFLRRFEAFARDDRMIVAPEALSRFYVSPEPGRHGPASVVGATWMTREDRETEIGDYVSYLDRLADTIAVGSGRVIVLGFSQGVATATRWVVRGRVRPDLLILWGDLTPPDLDVERAGPALERVDVALVRGDDDPAFDPRLVSEEEVRLRSAGVEYRVVRYAGGHDIDAEVLNEVLRPA